MRSDRYFHPEFGWLAPTSRLRRELRVGFLSLLLGLGIGAAAVTVLSTHSHDPDSDALTLAREGGTDPSLPATAERLPDRASAARLEAAGRTSSDKQDHAVGNPGAAAADKANSDPDARKACRKGACGEETRSSADPRPPAPPALSDAPVRLPTGRSNVPASDTLPSAQRADIAPPAPVAPDVPTLAPQSTTAEVMRRAEPTLDQAKSTPLSRKNAKKSARSGHAERRKAPDGYAAREDWAREASPRDDAREAASADRAYARGFPGPRGFWAWSR